MWRIFSELYATMCSYTMHNHGMMAQSVVAICHFCLFKVDVRHEYKW